MTLENYEVEVLEHTQDTIQSKTVGRVVIVRSPVGSVAGVIDRGDIIKALDSKLLWRIPSEYIKQIKADGKFPPNFRLVEICEQLNQNNQ